MISVLTPSFNYARFLGDCLDSVAADPGPHEHLVADNVSRDGTEDLLSSRADDRLHYTIEADNGQSDALNALLSRARGDVVGWLNADEYYLPGALSTARAFFDAHPSIDVLYGDVVFVDRDRVVDRLLSRHRPSAFVLRHRGCYISTCAAFVRTSALKGFAFDGDLRQIMDWDFFLHLLSHGATFAYLARPLGAFRAHEERVTATPLPRNSEEHRRVRMRYGLTVSPRVWAADRAAGDLAYRALKTLDGGVARERRFQAWRGTRLDVIGDAARRIAELAPP